MNAYFQAHKSRVTVWKLLYGSMERGIGAPRMQMELLLRAVRRSTGTAGGCKQTKAVSVTKKSGKPAGMRLNEQSKHADRMERLNSGRAYFNRKQADA
ncbi:hypothetical protein SAMN05216403_101260 [Nitrosospira multiformis ATCC 25196]|uniref:Uncharacterized protein n=1 Tax=Nitrosospira multiformis (strain ATCC 25196 / NCIMB 11849 / C 71) TaxID=323848 RepID=Q2YBP1_NITMU|nr:hypothetical protein [Nitrosospira multiformis]ABB73830.1 hypothetical protein Nmul_A0522 [Nitrosospira multiformis ATCC 25196]SEF42919.1 hypothetical protein SAMN05216403_101260 [Nitrosospira multiformis ATCC 25196]